MKRFKIFDPSGRYVDTTHDKLKDVVLELLSKRLGTSQYYIECRKDDITIPANELLEAWASGERPDDLQFF
jgi:hypothetical protein